MGRRLGLNFLLFLLLLSAFAGGVWLRLSFVPAPSRINPQAEIDPGKHYTLTLWDFERPLGSEGASYQAELNAALESFRTRYPNATVTIELLPWSEEEGAERLATALKQGAPPDVLATGPLTGGAWGPLVVPCGPYLAPGEADEYLVPGWTGGTGKGGLVAWPRWLEPACWAGNKALLAAAGVPVEAIQATGWNWEELGQAAARVRALPGGPALFTSFDLVSLWGELGRGSAAASASGSPWSPENVRAAAERAAALWENGAVPRSIGREGYSALDDFFTGQVAVLGPVHPWFFRAAAERAERVIRGGLEPGAARPFPLALLPPPGRGESGVVVRRAEQIYVFRQRRYQGDDHTRLAMELARHLSRSSARLAARLDLVPTYRPAQAEWAKEWAVGEGKVLLTQLERGTALAEVETEAAAAERRARLAPLLQRFWKGELSPGELAAQILE